MRWEDVKRFAGPQHAQHRAEVSARARETMRTRRRCEQVPEVVKALHALAHASYPAWYTDAFLFSPTSSAQLRPCAQ
jgi:hypothetical protein